MSVKAKIYSGCYGGDIINQGDIITCTLECPSYPSSLTRKQVIFVVDESGSMSETIKSLKSSLFAARNSLLRLNGIDLSNLDESQRDIIFSQTCNSTLITFSDQAICRWESELAYTERRQPNTLTKSFSKAVNEIEATTCTNMGDALLMAFEKKNPEYFTWIIVLTDGISNKGSYQTTEAFRTLMLNMPEFTKIIPLGYTTNFDPDTLSALGLMTYVETEENISEIIGSITAEIGTCYGFHGTINLPSLSDSILTSDDIISVPDDIGGNSREIIGSRNFGCLFNQRRYTYGFLPWGNFKCSRYREYIGLTGSIDYFDIKTNTLISIPFTIEDGGHEIPDEIRESYFIASKGRILLSIHAMQQANRINSKYIESIEQKLKDWNHPLSIPHKQEILRMLKRKNNRATRMSSLTSAQSTQYQSGYATISHYTTPSQRTESLLTSNDANIYSSDIMIPYQQS